MFLVLLSGCELEVGGRVVEPNGAPVAGALLDGNDGGCTAVTDASGAFSTRCVRADYQFVVTHPSHAAGALHVDATGALSPPPSTATLVPWPAEPGLYLEPDYTPLAGVGLIRATTPTEQRFCLPAGAAVPTARGGVRLFDVHATEWRLFAADDEGCAYRLRLGGAGRYWSPEATRIDPNEVSELAPGRSRVSFALPAGRYVAVPWMDGFLVPEDPVADTWTAWAFEVPAAPGSAQNETPIERVPP